MGSKPADVKKESKKVIGVGMALLSLTAVTTAAGKLPVGMGLAVLIALLIATLKGSLVASFFMHLVSEKKAVHVLLITTLSLFIAMIALILLGYYDVYEGLRHVP